MFKNYITIAIRTLLKHRLYSLINVLGLGIGIACVILITLYVQNELNYDAQHENADQIYRIIREFKSKNGQKTYDWRISGAVGPALIEEFPEVKTTVRTMTRSVWINHQDKTLNHVFCLADPNILDVFTFPMAQGDKKALLQPKSVLLTESAAQQYFGSANPIGKILEVEGAYIAGAYTVAGVLKDLPKYNTLRFDVLTASVPPPTQFGYWEAWVPRANWRAITVYALLKENASVETIKPKLKDFMARKMGPEIAERNTYHLQPFNEVYLRSRTDYNIQETFSVEGLIVYGDIGHLYAASATALFILLIACINFTNLTTARAANRAREVDLRKVVGAHRTQLAFQFLGESLILTLLSLIVGLGIVELCLPAFNHLIDTKLSLILSSNLLIGLIGLTLIVGLIAGSYPALFLSHYRPVDVLKGTLASGARGGLLRKTLVVFQFATSVALIVITLIVSEQMAYIQTKNLGFDKAQIVETRLLWEYRQSAQRDHDRLWENYDIVKNAFLQHPNITEATVARFNHGRGAPQATFSAYQGGNDEWLMRMNEVDEDFIDVFKIPLVAGRNFTKNAAKNYARESFFQRDENGQIIDPSTMPGQAEYILNEAAVKALGWTDPIGRKFGVKNRRSGLVVGVVKNFHTRSLREAIEPTVIYASNINPKIVFLKIEPTNVQETIAHMESVWKRFVPNRPFVFTFMDDNLNRRYADEQQLSRAMGVFSTLAIFVACLGLLGLISFLAEQRTKEVGIRKVLGASTGNIVTLFLKESIRLVLIACLLAWPIAYWAVQNWLQGFAYRIGISAWPFLIGGLFMIALTLITMAYQVMKTGRINPVEALRYE